METPIDQIPTADAAQESASPIDTNVAEAAAAVLPEEPAVTAPQFPEDGSPVVALPVDEGAPLAQTQFSMEEAAPITGVQLDEGASAA